MVQLLKAPKVEVLTNTDQGECNVRVTLDINLNLNGATVSVAEAQPVKQEEDAPFLVPDFAPSEKVKFGEKVSNPKGE